MMFNTFTTSILVLVSFSLPSLGASICAYTTRSCSGSVSCCTNALAGTCCQWSSTFGFSVKFSGMPQTSTWMGQTFNTAGCRNLGGGGGASGGQLCTGVFDSSFNPWVSANWLNQGFAPRRGLLEGEATEGSCISPDVIGYTTAGGKERLVKIPDGQYARLSELLASGNHEAEFANLDEGEL